MMKGAYPSYGTAVPETGDVHLITLPPGAVGPHAGFGVAAASATKRFTHNALCSRSAFLDTPADPWRAWIGALL